VELGIVRRQHVQESGHVTKAIVIQLEQWQHQNGFNYSYTRQSLTQNKAATMEKLEETETAQDSRLE
jgi:hypothetical protein